MIQRLPTRNAPTRHGCARALLDSVPLIVRAGGGCRSPGMSPRPPLPLTSRSRRRHGRRWTRRCHLCRRSRSMMRHRGSTRWCGHACRSHCCAPLSITLARSGLRLRGSRDALVRDSFLASRAAGARLLAAGADVRHVAAGRDAEGARREHVARAQGTCARCDSAALAPPLLRCPSAVTHRRRRCWRAFS